MKIEQIKKQMMDYTDLFGSSLINSSEISKAKSKAELSEIIENHYEHLSDRANDAQHSLERFGRSLGLSDLT